MANGKTVAMTRDPEQFPAPHRADVHPDEVENFAAGGWVVSAQPAPAEDGKKAAGKKT